jgi:carbon monoxide dehydrogenase subunit G
VFGVGTTMSFTVAPSGAGTRVTMTADVQGRGLRRLLAPVVTSEMRKSTVAALAALQARLGGP